MIGERSSAGLVVRTADFAVSIIGLPLSRAAAENGEKFRFPFRQDDNVRPGPDGREINATPALTVTVGFIGKVVQPCTFGLALFLRYMSGLLNCPTIIITGE